MKHLLQYAAALAACLLQGLSTQAQLSFGGQPVSWQTTEKALAPIVALALPTQDNAVLLAEAQAITGPAKNVKFGKPLAAMAKANTHGRWREMADGTRVWQLQLNSPGARHLSVLFRRMSLPKGATLFLYSANREYVYGAITSLSNPDGGLLYTVPLPTDQLVLEIAVDADHQTEVDVEIKHVVHGFRDLPVLARSLSSFGASGTCHIDAACNTAQVYPDASRSVGIILESFGAGCTGAMINNTNGDGRPLFLTADHCNDTFDGEETAYAVLFNYQRSGCSTGTEGVTTRGLGGATLLARTRTTPSVDPPYVTDFMLFELKNRPPASWNVFYAGWNRTNTGPTSVYCFSHPCGDVKKFAYMTSTPTLATLDASYTNRFWEVNWNGSTATEPGSSGSPLFDPQQRIIGQLFGGDSYCAGASTCRSSGTAYVAGPDFYGVLGRSWDGPSGATSTNRLKDHLDPTNSGVSTLSGANTPSPAPEGYCFSGAESYEDSRIDRVRFATLNVASNNAYCARYTNFTTQSTSVTAGQTYTLTITKGKCGSTDFSYVAKAWIDWNADRDFDDAGEQVALFGPQTTPGDLAVSVTVPASVVNGTTTVMRVVVREKLTADGGNAGAIANTQACDIYGYGETEDFTINLVNGTTAIEDAQGGYNDPSLEVFPNPASAPVTVRWRIAPQDGPALLWVVDANGGAAHSANLRYDEVSGAYVASLASGQLAPGSYLVRVGAGERVSAKRLVVVR